ncbi:MAG: outer membrane lipoprotein carrier protein LolA [Ahniella sp.]|nr:outer membrane lipoprotein carrier protein LolA [Ahniella sp.]
MISGKRLALLLLAISPTVAHAEAPTGKVGDATAAVARFKREAPMQEAFVEYRFSRFTRQPVKSLGELRYLGADQLVRAVRLPRPETSTIGQGMIRIERPGQKVRQVSLKRVPELQALLASFTGLLGGDAARLAPLFTLDFTESATGFTLKLTPRAAAMQKRISHIDVLGAGSTVSCLVFAEPDREQSIVLLGAKATSVAEGVMDAPALLTFCRLP